MSITTFFMLLGGLGLFLFGMKLMSEGLEKAAGAKMRRHSGIFHKEPFYRHAGRYLVYGCSAVFKRDYGHGSQFCEFWVDESASGFRGHTWSQYRYHGDRTADCIQPVRYRAAVRHGGRDHGHVLQETEHQEGRRSRAGIGILFMGLSIMGDAMTSFKESPHIIELLRTLRNPFAAILVGFVITAILQSSSATVGIVILMASQGLLAFTICPFLILGCNIGSCVSALLASLGGKKDAKRAAMIHFLFNVVGSAIAFIILMVALDPITQGILHLSRGNTARRWPMPIRL